MLRGGDYVAGLNKPIDKESVASFSLFIISSSIQTRKSTREKNTRSSCYHQRPIIHVNQPLASALAKVPQKDRARSKKPPGQLQLLLINLRRHKPATARECLTRAAFLSSSSLFAYCSTYCRYRTPPEMTCRLA